MRYTPLTSRAARARLHASTNRASAIHAPALTVSALLVGALALAGCRPPDPTPPEAPPAPQAGGQRNAVADPLDKAQAVERAVEDADARRRDALDDAESGTR